MGYLIDTNIWVDVERGALAPADIAAITQNEPVFISPVTIAELQFGAERSKTAAIRQQRLAALKRLRRKPLLRIDGETGEIFGSLAAQLESKRGHQFRIQDLWLAAQALQTSNKLFTRNGKDFKDVPGLELVTLSTQ